MSEPRKTKSRRALLLEYNKLSRARMPFLKIHGRLLDQDEMAQFVALSSAYQAIAWALSDGAVAPSKCYGDKTR